jgi:hypothetical protein
MHCVLMLDLAVTILSYFISQLGSFLDDEVHTPNNNTKETMEEHLFRCQPFIYRLTLWLLSFLVAACSINTSLGAIFFFCGFLTYLWDNQPRFISKALILVVMVLATPILLYMGVCITTLAGVVFVWVRIKCRGLRDEDDGGDSGDQRSNRG